MSLISSSRMGSTSFFDLKFGPGVFLFLDYIISGLEEEKDGILMLFLGPAILTPMLAALDFFKFKRVSCFSMKSEFFPVIMISFCSFFFFTGICRF